MMELVLYPPTNSVAFSFINVNIRWYGLTMALAIFVGIFFCYLLMQKKYENNAADVFLDFIPYTILISIIGARLFYIIGEFDYYLKNPVEVFLINHGGLSIWGAILFGYFSLLYFSKSKKIKLLKFCDAICVVLPLSQAIGRWGNFFNQEAYGAPSNFIFKMYIDSAHRLPGYFQYEYFHPTFFYESVLNVLLFAFLITLFIKSKELKSGTIFAVYLIAYSVIRLLVESIRLDSVFFIFNLPIASVISFIGVIVGLTLLIKINKSTSI